MPQKKKNEIINIENKLIKKITERFRTKGWQLRILVKNNR